MIIIGNLVRDPELRTTSSGVNVCGFTVAVNKPKKNGQDQGADYFSVTAWRERGEMCAKFLTKGKKVCVVGPVGVRTYQKQSGETGVQLEVTAEEVEFLSPRNENIDPQSGMQKVEVDDLPY